MKNLKDMVLAAAAVAALTIAPIALSAQDKKPDFSGKWVLDEAKSQPVGAGRAGRTGGAGGGGGGRAGRAGGALAVLTGTADGPVLISLSPTEITIGALTYKFEGTSSPGGRGMAESKVRWDGPALVIETTINARGTTAAAKQVRKLSDDGKEMTVETTVNTQRGDMTGKQVFKRE